MWIHVLEEEKQSYFFKYHVFNESYDFYLTNFINLWQLRLSKNDLASLIQVWYIIWIILNFFLISSLGEMYVFYIKSPQEARRFPSGGMKHRSQQNPTTTEVFSTEGAVKTTHFRICEC